MAAGYCNVKDISGLYRPFRISHKDINTSTGERFSVGNNFQIRFIFCSSPHTLIAFRLARVNLNYFPLSEMIWPENSSKIEKFASERTGLLTFAYKTTYRIILHQLSKRLRTIGKQHPFVT